MFQSSNEIIYILSVLQDRHGREWTNKSAREISDAMLHSGYNMDMVIAHV